MVLGLVMGGAMVLPTRAQADFGQTVTFIREVDALPEVVEEKARELAEDRGYLEDVTSGRYPRLMVVGTKALKLRIHDVPFTFLVLRSRNHLGKAFLHSRQKEVPDEVKKRADAFVEEVVEEVVERANASG